MKISGRIAGKPKRGKAKRDRQLSKLQRNLLSYIFEEATVLQTSKSLDVRRAYNRFGVPWSVKKFASWARLDTFSHSSISESLKALGERGLVVPTYTGAGGLVGLDSPEFAKAGRRTTHVRLSKLGEVAAYRYYDGGKSERQIQDEHRQEDYVRLLWELRADRKAAIEGAIRDIELIRNMGLWELRADRKAAIEGAIRDIELIRNMGGIALPLDSDEIWTEDTIYEQALRQIRHLEAEIDITLIGLGESPEVRLSAESWFKHLYEELI